MESRKRQAGNRRLGCLVAILTATTSAFILEGGIRLDDRWRSQKPAAAAEEVSLLEKNPAGTGSYRLRPKLDIEVRVENRVVRIRTNSHGMHWRETNLTPQPGRPRVAFLGDSFTFGSWARDAAHSFVGVFETSLPEPQVEALNFGVGGYGLLDEELLLNEKVLDFDPEYVIVVIYTGNDFRDTWLGLDRERIVNGTAHLNEETLKARVPAEQLVEDNRVALECPAAPWRRAAETSAAFRRIAPLLNMENLCVRFRPNLNFFMPGFWSRVPPPEISRQATQAVLEALSRMNDVLTLRRARLGVVVLPTADQVYAQEAVGRGFDTGLPQREVGVFCRDRRVPYLDLLPLLRQQAQISNRRMYLRTDTHLNDFGHAKVGQLIAAWFEARVRRPPGANR